MSFHAGQTFTYGETPSAAKMQYIWDNDYALADGTGISNDAIIARHILNGAVTSDKTNFDIVEQTLASTFTSSASATAQDTGLKVTLPTAGKWLVMANMRMANTTTNNYGVYTLYNQTTSTTITNSERIGNFDPAASGIQTTTPMSQVVTTTTTNNIIRVNLTPGGAYAVSANSDNNGRCFMMAIRIKA